MKAATVLRRGGWTLTDQALSSLSNLGVTILVARATSPEAFGAFALAYITYMCALGASQAIASEPLIIRFSAASGHPLRTAISRATGTAVLMSGAASAGCVVAGILTGGTLGTALFALAIALPGLLLQDCWRFVFFSSAQPRKAAINDAVWCLGEVAAFLAVFLNNGHPSVFTLILAWGAGAWIAALVGVFQSRILPRPLQGLSWLRANRDLAPALVADFLMMTAGMPLTLYVLGTVGGLAAVGGLDAAQTLLGPLSVILMASRIFAIPECVRLRHRNYRRLPAAVAWLAGASMVVAGIYGLALARLVPSSVGVQLLGASWPSAKGLLLPLAVMVIARAATIAAMVGLRALDAPRRLLRARLLSSPLIVLGGVVGAMLDDATGAAIGLAVGQWLGLGPWWTQFRRGYREGSPVSQTEARMAVTIDPAHGREAPRIARQIDPSASVFRRPQAPRRRSGGVVGARRVTTVVAFTAVAYGALLVWSSNTGASNIQNLLLVVPVLAAATGFLLPKVLRGEDDPRIRRLLVAAFFIKIVMVVVAYVVTFKIYREVDANVYHESGVELAKQFGRGDYSYTGKVVGTSILKIAVGVIYTIFGPTRLGASLIFGWVSFWGTYFFYRAFKVAIPRGNVLRYACLIFLLPSMLFWTTGIGKDSWMLFFLGLATYQIARILAHQSPRLGVLGLGLVAMAIVRPHIVLLLVGGFAFAFLIRRETRRNPSAVSLSPLLRIIGFSMIALLGVVVANQTQRFLNVEQLDAESVTTVLANQTTASSRGGSAFAAGNAASLKNYPNSLVTVLFRPFPNEAGNILALLASIEGLALLALVLTSLRRIAYAVRHGRTSPYVVLAAVYSLIFIYAFGSFGNFGLIIRERTQLWPFVFVLLAAAPVTLRGRRPTAVPSNPETVPPAVSATNAEVLR